MNKRLFFLSSLWAGILAWIYLYIIVYFPLDRPRFTVIFFVKVITFTVLCNAGFVLLTTNFSRKFKVITTLAFAPSIIVSPVMAGIYFIPAFFIVLVVNVFYFVKLNPWKNHAMVPAHPQS